MSTKAAAWRSEVSKALLKAANALSANSEDYWSDGDRSAPRTPWGPAQGAYNIAPGVIWFSTAGHGGLMVSNSVAQKLLSDAARKMADKWNGNYWFEEDVQYVIAFYENPEWSVVLHQIAGGTPGGTAEDFEPKVQKYFPKYFTMTK